MKYFHALKFSIAYSLVTISSSVAEELGPEMMSPDQEPIAGYLKLLPSDEIKVSRKLKDRTSKARQQMKERGYIDVDEMTVTAFDSYYAAYHNQKLSNLSEVVPNLSFIPASFAGTAFQRSTLLGAASGGDYASDIKTSLVRVFTHPEFGLLVLREIDYVNSRSVIIQDKSAINIEINGNPGVMTAMESSSKKGMTQLTWYTDSMVYELTTAKKLLRDHEGYNQFIELATSLY